MAKLFLLLCLMATFVVIYYYYVTLITGLDALKLKIAHVGREHNLRHLLLLLLLQL